MSYLAVPILHFDTKSLFAAYAYIGSWFRN